MSRPLCSCFVLCAAAILLTGCGRSGDGAAERPRRVPAGGTVLHNQKPVEGATVVFSPQEGGNGAVGRTDGAGRFKLQTFDSDDGAVPGEYKVMIQKVEIISEGTPESDDDELPAAEQRWLLPEKYAQADTSELTATVTEGGENNFRFELED